MLCTFSCLCPGDTGAFCVHRSVDLRILLPLFDLGDHVIKYYAECWLMFDSTTPNPVTRGTNRKAISKCKSLIRLLVKQAALLKVKTALSDWGPFGRFWTASLLSWLLRFSIAMAIAMSSVRGRLQGNKQRCSRQLLNCPHVNTQDKRWKQGDVLVP